MYFRGGLGRERHFEIKREGGMFKLSLLLDCALNHVGQVMDIFY